MVWRDGRPRRHAPAGDVHGRHDAPMDRDRGVRVDGLRAVRIDFADRTEARMVAFRKLTKAGAVPVLITLLIFVAAWEGAIALFHIPDFVLPHLAQIAVRLSSDSHLLADALAATLSESLGGFVIGAVLGLAIASLMVLI